MRAQNMAGGSIDPTLRLLADPDLFQKRLDQLEKAQRDAQAVIDQVGPAEQILHLRSEVELDRTKARDVLSAAEEKADTTVAAANDEAALMIDKAKAAASDLITKAEG